MEDHKREMIAPETSLKHLSKWKLISLKKSHGKK